MRNYYTIVLLFFCTALHAQTREFTVVDSLTNLPVSKASLFSSTLNEHFLTNDDGKVKIKIIEQSDTLLISCVGYNKSTFLTKNMHADTIKLKPAVILLEEVTVNSIDIKRKLKKLLENYHKLYFTKPIIYDCTYRESFKLNDTLSRLAQVQLKWADENYKFDFTKNYANQTHILLSNIDYAKIPSNVSGTADGFFIENIYLINYLHLNFYPIIVNYGTEINIKSVEKFEDYTKVIFSTPIVEKNEITMYLNDGIIYFDNRSDAVIKIEFKNIYNHQINNSFTKNKVAYTSQIKTHEISLSFNKFNDEKWVLSSFKSDMEGEVIINNKRSDFKIIQELLITNVSEKGKILKKDQIDLKKPFFENIAKYKNIDPKILLTKEEEIFMNDK